MITPSQHFIPYITAKSCDEIFRKNKSSFFIAFKFLPKKNQQALIKIYTFFRIADDCVDNLSEPTQQEAALSFWENELNKIYTHQPQHPVMKELAVVISEYNIPQHYLTGLIKGCRMDIVKNRYKNFAELEDYCYHVAGLVGLTCMKIFNYESPTANQTALHLGLAFQLTNIMRDVGADLELGRIYLPQDLLHKHNYSESDLLNKKMNANFVALMTEMAERAQQSFKKGKAEFIHDTKNKLIATQIMTAVYQRVLEKICARRFDVLNHKISLHIFEKLCLIFPFIFKKVS